MQPLLQRVRQRWAEQEGDASARADAALPDRALSAGVRDVRLLLRAGGGGATRGPPGQVSPRKHLGKASIWEKNPLFVSFWADKHF